MKILYIQDSVLSFNNGCWFYRNNIPAQALKRKGHEIKYLALNSGRQIEEEIKEWPDTVVFSRTYPMDPLGVLRDFKRRGKRVIYEVDDDLWNVNPDNPSVALSEEKRRQYEHLMNEADACTTTTEVLAKLLRKFNKNVFVCPNAVDASLFALKREPVKKERLRIGYAGAASHWGDLMNISEALKALNGKYDFEFCFFGMCGSPLEAEMYQYEMALLYNLTPEKKKYLEAALAWYRTMKNVRMFHVPFYPPMMYSEVLAGLDFDIGIIPLNDNQFNHSKSCIKFYEYATIKAATLSSHVTPYKEEVGYTCKNTVKDWTNKLEKLIKDESFRKKLQEKQSKWVKENRDINKIVTLWEDAFDPIQKHE